MKRICGAEAKGNTVFFAVIEGKGADFNIIKTKVKKIDLVDHLDQGSMKEFSNEVRRFLEDNEIDFVFMKAGNSSGMYTSGGPVFKMETVIQLLDTQVKLLKPQTLNSYYKKVELVIDSLDLNKYQHGAFKAAYYGMEK